MVILTKIFDGEKVETRVWRDVYKQSFVDEIRAGFKAQKEYNQWGIMARLRGTRIILLDKFGNIPEREMIYG